MLLVCSPAFGRASRHVPNSVRTAVDDAPLLRSGTAFFVSPEGLMLTSAHNVTGCQHINIWPQYGPASTASIRVSDERLDLALLTTRAVLDAAALVPWGKERPARSALYTIGFGMTPSTPRVPVLTRGSMSGVAWAAGRRVLVVRARLYAGYSGAPVLDTSGALQGVVVGRYSERPELGVVVPTQEIVGFLTSNGVDLWRDKRRTRLRVGASERLRRIAVLVQCADAIEGN
ncbi:serine protease [Paraburkholderia sp. IW21]|uniref:S1 family peptidase n=1 Tax=Paraburkholderia sp. IW21 TaxID=3242488 RepID=UPI00351FE58C